MPTPVADIHKILKKYWGFDSFRPLQEDIINSILSGKDTLGLMPTGGGKSLTFQVPGLSFESGLTIVVTPLISLMKDQVDNLKKLRIKGVFLHSGMSAKENRIAWEQLINGKARFLYVSPEKLDNENFLIELRSLKVNLITIDEAHCISQWGYDFRPAYLNIRKLRKIKPYVPVLALTATATPKVADDIMLQLEFRNPGNIFRKSFSRDNINYIIRKSDTKIHDVLHILSRTQGSSIVYVRSRKRTREIADYLISADISATYYHAGLDNSIKIQHQNDWKSNKTRVMVATNAFGMGIDKPDVRVVIHYDIPPSLEEYYQEAGRAGRDGMKSYAVLLTLKSDKALLHRRVSEAFPERKIVKEIYQEICNFLHVSIGEGYETVREFDIIKYCKLFGRKEKQCRSALRLLSQSGYMHFIEDADKRSRIKIMCEREELYLIQNISAKAEKVLYMSMRLFTGLFSDFVYIRESEIAQHLKLSDNEIYESMLELDRLKIISYVPRSGLPMIYFPTAREETVSMIIPREIFEIRKSDMEARTEAIIDYSFSEKGCRVKRMLAYFGEEDSCDCGKCDVCRNKNKVKKFQSSADNLNNLISILRLHAEGLSFTSISSICKGDKLEMSKNLNELCNEGFVIFHDGKYFPQF